MSCFADFMLDLKTITRNEYLNSIKRSLQEAFNVVFISIIDLLYLCFLLVYILLF